MRAEPINSGFTVATKCGERVIYLATAEEGDTEGTGCIPCLVEHYTQLGMYCRTCERLHDSMRCPGPEHEKYAA